MTITFKELRTLAGFPKQVDLVNFLNVTRQTVNEWEKEDSKPPTAVLMLLRLMAAIDDNDCIDGETIYHFDSEAAIKLIIAAISRKLIKSLTPYEVGVVNVDITVRPEVSIGKICYKLSVGGGEPADTPSIILPEEEWERS